MLYDNKKLFSVSFSKAYQRMWLHLRLSWYPKLVLFV